jgi:phosphotransferase system  glucose/maltose/N-acetylglucosamine-specific IIC component
MKIQNFQAKKPYLIACIVCIVLLLIAGITSLVNDYIARCLIDVSMSSSLLIAIIWCVRCLGFSHKYDAENQATQTQDTKQND